MTAYADPELLVGQWLKDTLGIHVRADPDLPSDWLFDAPITHVQRGQSLGAAPLSLDDVTLDVDTYAANADHARKVAGDIWSAIVLQLPLTTFQPSGIFVKLAAATTPPLWTPDPSVYRRTAAYRVILHGFVT